MLDTISLKMPAKAQNALAVRLLVAGLANLNHFDSEEIEDMKLAVSEACTCISDAEHLVQMSFLLEEQKMIIEIQGSHPSKRPMLEFNDAALEGIGFLLMKNLMDSMEIHSGDQGTFIRLVKNQKSAVPVKTQ